MDTIFMNSENSRNSQTHVLILLLTDKLDLRRHEKTIALSNISVYNTWKNIKSLYHNSKVIISAPPRNNKFELTDESYSISYSVYSILFWIFLKKHGENVDNPSVRIYVNKIENGITFKIKTGYYLEFLTPETMKLLRSTGKNITKDKD